MSEIFLCFIFLIPFLYALFLLWAWSGWEKLLPYKSAHANFTTPVSVIVPARNEEESIEKCLRDILRQDYPAELYEILVADDQSTDETAAVVTKIIGEFTTHKISLLRNQTNSKKQALTAAIQKSAGELIVTTDADCRMQSAWLTTLVSYYEEKRPEMICGPVCLSDGKNYFEKVQQLEFFGLTGIGAGCLANGKPMMCSGANLAFSRKIFDEVNGYEGAAVSVSGDDTQLMLKIADRKSSAIHFLKSKEASVITSPVKTFPSLWSQRNRWASKIPFRMNALTFFAAAIAWLLHVGLLVLFLYALNNFFLMRYLFVILSIKIIPEYILLSSLTAFYEKKKLVRLLIPAQAFYILYITCIGMISPVGSFKWKERRVRSSSAFRAGST